MIEPVEDRKLIRIGVFGIGGAGCNAVNHMIDTGLANVEFYAVNTDLQALSMSQAANKVQIGAQLTGGLGSGGDPNIGQKAVEESIEIIRENVTGFDMLFIEAGEGGGTGTGAAPLIAETGKQQGALVVAVVTRPFDFEGKSRARKAADGIRELRSRVDTLIVLPNQRILEVHGKEPCFEAFRMADEVLLNAVRGISEIVTCRQLINIDFADVRSVMAERGGAVMAAGFARGEGRATEAAHQALNSPLIENVSIETARKVLLNISGDSKMTLKEVDEAASIIFHSTNGQADIRMGAARPRGLKDGMKVTLIATGLNEPLPNVEDVAELLNDAELFPARRRFVSKSGEITVDRNDLEIPTFLRRNLD
ncbi:cell division protein FtsZ [candidate division WOR-3 bacterium JGI_Cruoil_03_51_56]|uniref:Cell division protein FtsZ n=1 Tax=candidate division WOR-3 bacterium JGI_Cruoil_03_51_56 TaxID=1973747 RepID=A0A235BVP2_UNCW3|nr:MAG: cell division protein FtsZ [candidate division WOR-3 bacterium JGI_Cruoil_03_51_56]